MSIAIEQRRMQAEAVRSNFGHCTSCQKELRTTRPCRGCGSCAIAKWIMFMGWLSIAVSMICLVLGFANRQIFANAWVTTAVALPSGLVTVGFGWMIEYLANIEWHHRQSRQERMA